MRVRRRLLILASTFPAVPGDGTPGFVADLAAVQAETFDTLVLLPRVPGSVADEHRDGYRIHRFRFFFRRWEDLAQGAILENIRAGRWRLFQVPAFLVAEVVAVRRAVRQFDPEVVHVHWMVPQGIAALLGAGGRPMVITTLGGDLYALTGPLWLLLKRAVLHRARAITVMNTDMARRVRELGVPADRVHVLPMGANADRVREAGDGVQAVPGRLLFAGRLVEKKGVAILLDALATLTDLPWTLDIVGDGPLRAGLEAQARPLGSRVRFLGQQHAASLARLWHTCEIAVVPSMPARSGDQDGLPVALLEAMTAGRAVVASDIPGIQEAIIHGEHGKLVPPGNSTALATALRQLLTDDRARQALGRAAAGRAEAYSMRAVAGQYVDLLTAQLGEQPRPAR
ncbi:MAG: glycosyltransferase [Actinomycetota bacterium]|nr:glycosyltransferase [Actinomycetota bacterium]